MLMKLLTSLLLWLPACAAPEAPTAQGAPQSQPQAQPAAPPPATQPIAIPQDVPPGVAAPQLPAPVNDLLDRLERSAADLQAFSAEVSYEKQDAILGRRELRVGNVIYQRDAASKSKSFAILLDFTIVNNKRRNDPKHYIFNGRWLAEIDHNAKQFIKREIVPPGKELDPLKLGEGPFPLPVGQPKAEVLARFDVTAAELPKDGLLKDLQNVDGLLLVPKPEAKEAKEYAKVVLFYDRVTLLPVGILVSETNADQKVVRLTNAQRNPALTPEQTAKLNIEEPDPREWHIDVRPWTQGD